MSAKGLQDGLVYFTRAELPASQTNLHGTVADRLTDAAGQLEIGATIAGMQVTQYRREVKSNWAEARLGASIQSNDQRIKIGVVVRLFIDPQKQLVTVSLACMEPSTSNGCGALLDQTQFDSAKSLATTEVLGPAEEPFDLGGFQLGESEADFFAACKKRGLTKVDLGPPPADAEKSKEGSPAECKGTDPSFPWGPLDQVTGSFVGGKAMLFTFDTDIDTKTIDAKLDKVMLKGTLRQPGGLRFPKPAAHDFELIALGAVETPSKPGKGSLFAWSRTAWDAVHPVKP